MCPGYNSHMDIQLITSRLRRCWSAETAYPGTRWTGDNPARGQCAVSSLLVQDLLGGELVRFMVEYRGKQEKHFANSVGGVLIDTTRGQYGTEGVFVESVPNLEEFSDLRAKLLSDENTAHRYYLLKERFTSIK